MRFLFLFLKGRVKSLNYSNAGLRQPAGYNTGVHVVCDFVLWYPGDKKWLKNIDNIVPWIYFIVSYTKNRTTPGGTLPQLGQSSVLACLFCTNTGSLRITRALTSSLCQLPSVSVSSNQPAAPLWFTQLAHSVEKTGHKSLLQGFRGSFSTFSPEHREKKNARKPLMNTSRTAWRRSPRVATQPSD